MWRRWRIWLVAWFMAPVLAWGLLTVAAAQQTGGSFGGGDFGGGGTPQEPPQPPASQPPLEAPPGPPPLEPPPGPPPSSGSNDPFNQAGGSNYGRVGCCCGCSVPGAMPRPGGGAAAVLALAGIAVLVTRRRSSL